MPSAARSGGGSVLSSMPGGAGGEPLSATNSRVPSGDTLTPRGRLPSGMVSTTSFVPPLMTVRSPEYSLVTYTVYPGADGASSIAAASSAGASPAPPPPHATANAVATAAAAIAKPYRFMFVVIIILFPHHGSTTICPIAQGCSSQ